MSQRESTATGAIDLSKLLEFGPWTGVRLAVVVLGAAGFLIYGSTAQLLGLAIPVLVKEWHLTRGAFVPVVVGGLATISLGSIFAGALGDKFGPKRTLGASMLLVALATAAGALSNSLPWFVLARIIAGLGIGGTMPNAISLIAEYAPKKYNSNIILAAAIFTPIGGIMAGYLAALEESGVSWRALFMICAAVSAIAALGSMVLVPESARFLFRGQVAGSNFTRSCGVWACATRRKHRLPTARRIPAWRLPFFCSNRSIDGTRSRFARRSSSSRS
ncbi:MAG: MFS transporter [Rhizomicrobium sp.]